MKGRGQCKYLSSDKPGRKGSNWQEAGAHPRLCRRFRAPSRLWRRGCCDGRRAASAGGLPDQTRTRRHRRRRMRRLRTPRSRPLAARRSRRMHCPAPRHSPVRQHSSLCIALAALYLINPLTLCCETSSPISPTQYDKAVSWQEGVVWGEM